MGWSHWTELCGLRATGTELSRSPVSPRSSILSPGGRSNPPAPHFPPRESKRHTAEVKNLCVLCSPDPRLAFPVCPPPLLQTVHTQRRASSGRVEVKDSGPPWSVMPFPIFAFLGLLAEVLGGSLLMGRGRHLEDTSPTQNPLLFNSKPSPWPSPNSKVHKKAGALCSGSLNHERIHLTLWR